VRHVKTSQEPLFLTEKSDFQQCAISSQPRQVEDLDVTLECSSNLSSAAMIGGDSPKGSRGGGTVPKSELLQVRPSLEKRQQCKPQDRDLLPLSNVYAPL
jgi:hypothetical protein